jgi:tetratricopeptide (TPR) repeat protein
MRNWLFILLGALVFLGCSGTKYDVPAGEKVFEEEDTLILFALDAEEHQKFAAAAAYYDLLYEKSHRTLYRDRAYPALLQSGQFDEVAKRVAAAREAGEGNATLSRYLVLALIGKQSYDKAESEALALVQETKTVDDYLLASEVYLKQKAYDRAMKYLERAYTIDYNEKILDKMAVIMYVNLGRKSEAIAQLESHSRLLGCSKLICGRLAAFYSDQNNVDGLLNTYTRLYAIEKDPETARYIIQIYSYKKAFPQLLQFLERTGEDDDLLLKLYINAKAYDKATELADRLYEQEGDAAYLGQKAIFQFESAKNKKDPALLERVFATLREVVKVKEEALYLNYLGYLMIDNDRNVEEGIGYVKRALAIEPDSPYYLDSLAWGYYKQNRCEKAYELMKQVEAKLGREDIEVRTHIEAIEKCLKGKKEK